MKVEIVDHLNGNKEFEASDMSGIYIYDADGNQYHIRPDRFGGLEVSSTDDKLSIEPSYSNLIYLKIRK